MSTACPVVEPTETGNMDIAPIQNDGKENDSKENDGRADRIAVDCAPTSGSHVTETVAEEDNPSNVHTLATATKDLPNVVGKATEGIADVTEFEQQSTNTCDSNDIANTNLEGGSHIEKLSNVNPFESEINSIQEATIDRENNDEEDEKNYKNPFEREEEISDIAKTTENAFVPVNPFESEINSKHDATIDRENNDEDEKSYKNPFEREEEISDVAKTTENAFVPVKPFEIEEMESDNEKHLSENIFDDEKTEEGNNFRLDESEKAQSPSACKPAKEDNDVQVGLVTADKYHATSATQRSLSPNTPAHQSKQSSETDDLSFKDVDLQDSEDTSTQNSNTDRPKDTNGLGTSQISSPESGGDVVVVTGGNGFLGQHIVKMLQLEAPHVKEIRVLDQVPFKQKLDYEATKPVKILTGSITDPDFVTSSVEGATSVLHIAGLVSFGTFPDFDGMQKVNVNGTLNIVNACLQQGVSRLVYCSTVDVVVGYDPIRGGNEENTPVPPDFLFPGYPDTKYQGERLVLGASQCPRKNGPALQTLSLRANVMYGELDPFYVTAGLKMANQRSGTLNQIGDGSAMFQQCYVGNIAWAFVCADRAMADTPELTSQFFYVPDYTPIQNTFNFMRPYLEARGFQLSNSHIPKKVAYGAIYASEMFAKLISPLKKLNLPAQSCSIAYINMDIFFRGDKAREVLKYEPIFTPVDARLVSMEYYKSVEL